MGIGVSAAAPAKKSEAKRIVWDRTSRSVVVAADRSFLSLIARLHREKPAWVIIVRTVEGSPGGAPEPHYYAYLRAEIEAYYSVVSSADESVEYVLNLHEYMASGVARRGQPRSFTPGGGVASTRIIDFDAAGGVAGVAEPLEGPDLGPMRGAQGGDPDLTGGAGTSAPAAITGAINDVRKGDDAGPLLTPPDKIDIVVSAEANQEIAVGDNAVVDFCIAVRGDASPLGSSRGASAKPDAPITVSLSVENDTLAVVRGEEQQFDPPVCGNARTGSFDVKGARTGSSRLAVTFRQGGTELGVIGLVIDVMEEAQVRNFERSTAATTAVPREPSDDDKLALIIERRDDNGKVFYQYILHSETLNLPYVQLRSQPLLDRGGGPAATADAFVQRIYQAVTQELKTFDDLNNLRREARALGAKLSQELFDPDVAKRLWPLRSKIHVIQIVSWEPYIPWELVRLRDPISGDIDDRFLAEYGLVRTLSDEVPSREIPMKTWRYLGATFPAGSFPPIGQELEYFTSTAPGSLRALGFAPKQIAAQRDDLYDTLADGDFDVLHISCHAESQHDAIDKATLIIGDQSQPGAARPKIVEVDIITIEAEAKLKRNRPLVFLNACETGRVGAVLTAWGGWPNVFLRAGASAFVGAAWAVRDKPAAAFSIAFYNALLHDQTLAEAASSARSAAKQLGDVSWLAFKVFGHPRARRAV
jgi:CHAT domain